jgi:hypothetical protein
MQLTLFSPRPIDGFRLQVALLFAGIAVASVYCIACTAIYQGDVHLASTVAWAASVWSGWILALPLLTQASSRTWKRRGLDRVSFALLLISLGFAACVEYSLRLRFNSLGLSSTPFLVVTIRQMPVGLVLSVVIFLLMRPVGHARDVHSAATISRIARNDDAIEQTTSSFGTGESTHVAETTSSPIPQATTAIEPALSVPTSDDLIAYLGIHPVRVPVDGLICVRAEENYVALHGNHRGVPLLRSTLTRMEALLEPSGFLRVHRSILVRRSAIIARLPHAQLLLSDGSVVPIGRTYRDMIERLACVPRRSHTTASLAAASRGHESNSAGLENQQ